MNKGNKDIKAIFWEMVEKESREEQLAYLDKVCGNDIDTRAQVEELMKAHERAEDFLEAPVLTSEIDISCSPLTEAPGTVIGRYKLLEKIGEGGMAVVYMAEQEIPIRRKVALKIIKLGMDTKSVIARFEAERQALAIMDHPNIAKVLEAGATETGRPYFVMDLVPGASITEYCDKNKLSIKERLTLFISVCNAVQHAHQKGIIHRDIKPSNIMVTQHDGKPAPKVIDFGIAKATNQRLTEKTLFTRYAHIIGTPAYMSPEQAELSDLDIDTRTDIYSLGVLLYELLTGTTPFSEEELREAGFLQMRKIICEEEPTKPSTKLSTLGKALTDVAKSHSSSPESMPKLVRGDLDWIVLKSMEKERTRRYDTASALAIDIQRHLDNKPVLARAPNAKYILQKFLRRHRSQVMATLAIVILISAVIVISAMWNQNRLKLAEAESLVHGSILFQARESFAKADYAKALERAKSILDSKYFGSEAKLLYAGILVQNQQLEEAVTKLEDLLNDSPEIAGIAYSLLARILWESETSDDEKLQKVDEYRQKAEELLPETAEAYFLQAMMTTWLKEKLELLDKALQIDPRHYESWRFRAFTFYAARNYESMERDALVMIVLNPEDPLGYSLRAIALSELGYYEDALKYYNAAIERTPEEDPQYIQLCDQRCEICLRMGEYERAIADAQECLILSPDSMNLKFRIFCALIALGNYEQASALFSEITDADPDSKRKFRAWSTKYVFDTLDAGGSWHPPDSKPEGVAFLRMMEAEETYWATRNPPEEVDSPDHSMSVSDDQKEYFGFKLGTPTNLGPPINSSADDCDISLSADGLITIFSSNRSDGSGGYDLWMSTRQTVYDPWVEPVNLGSTINTSSNEAGAALSADGLTLYFHSLRPGGVGGIDIYMSTRESIDDNWAKSVNIGSTVNSAYHDHCPFISSDGLELYFSSVRPGGYGYIDILVSTRETKDDPWPEPLNLGPPVNSEYEDSYPCLSVDGLTLFFSSGFTGGSSKTRPGLGDSDIWITRRKTKDDNWSEPVNLGPPVNSTGIEWCPIISADDSILYFNYDPWDSVPDQAQGVVVRPDIWQVPITLVPESIQKDGEVNSVRKSQKSNDRKEVMPDNSQ